MVGKRISLLLKNNKKYFRSSLVFPVFFFNQGTFSERKSSLTRFWYVTLHMVLWRCLFFVLKQYF